MGGKEVFREQPFDCHMVCLHPHTALVVALPCSPSTLYPLDNLPVSAPNCHRKFSTFPRVSLVSLSSLCIPLPPLVPPSYPLRICSPSVVDSPSRGWRLRQVPSLVLPSTSACPHDGSGGASNVTKLPHPTPLPTGNRFGGPGVSRLTAVRRDARWSSHGGV